MKTLVAGLFLMLSLAVGAGGQGKDKVKPDFSGTWIRDNAKSDWGRQAQSPLAQAEVTLKVAHHDPELKIVVSFKLNGQEDGRELAYYTDGRGETNPPTFGREPVKSKTKWDKNRIEARSSSSRTMQSGEIINIDISERWELSSDGKTLTDETTVSSPTVRTVKQVFTRVQ